MKVEKEKFDTLLGKLIKAKPGPRKAIRSSGKRGSKEAIIQPRENPNRKNR
jgi:hypothetical protein